MAVSSAREETPYMAVSARSRITLRGVNATLRPFESFEVGERAQYVRTVSEADVRDFAQVSGDDNALHLDEAFAARTRFGGRVAHGALSFGFLAASQTRLLGAGIIWLGASVKFTAPVRIGDTVVTETEIVEVDAAKQMLRVRCTARTTAGVVVMEGDSLVKRLKEAV
jgi:3-hydroxybutyryl-CoA dehydratase